MESARELLDRKIEELRLYAQQGLLEIVDQLAEDLIREVQEGNLSEDEKEYYFQAIKSVSGVRAEKPADEEERIEAESSITNETVEFDPEQKMAYARTLIEIQEWDEAIKVLQEIAATGYSVEQCYELCGDCAAKKGDIDKAISFYEIVYSTPGLSSSDKERILDKITRCQQKKVHRKRAATLARVSSGMQKVEAIDYELTAPDLAEQFESFTDFIGNVAKSWVGRDGKPLSDNTYTYVLKDLLYVGRTHAVFEAYCQESGETFAACTLVQPWNRCVAFVDIAEWAYTCRMMSCDFLDIPYDLAEVNGIPFLIRKHYEKSLAEYVNEQGIMSMEKACLVAYQILEGLGYLHLHVGADGVKRKIYHLDLRPSRVFLNGNGRVYLAYGGLWKLLQSRCPTHTRPRNLPIAFLPYRAPEQFRTYLWSDKRPQVVTDVYLFGVLFYELLTGAVPFQAESVEEHEILHCDQKVMPPQVWRPEIPDELVEIVMKCLEVKPQKRWRSTTQILLLLEKFLGGPSRVKELIKRNRTVDSV
ncbi:protein kinase domain-containing protein [Thermodesulforhabdus norvegica]|uniref:non-specific serine/threonine protein kinase n=1 Tax=Thermodesulforhabdus norvegica TaxID=39841 RepID=A0A1I4QLU3_9BACT|nr:protein kinase [Thermodesulforhabdus norvegica]SFM41027.1 Protein kinase domain-containing protein [Thermodesulforhabdus norvegica]